MTAPASREVALVGRPNAGKSALFNRLTGGGSVVGNYPGVTVDIVAGRLALPGGESVLIHDLPGLYSVDHHAEPATDERIAWDFLISAPPTLAVGFVVDVSHPRAGLGMYLEFRRIFPVRRAILILTQSDLLERAGQRVDVGRMERMLGTPVLLLSALAPDARERAAAAFSILTAAAAPALHAVEEGASPESLVTACFLAIEGKTADPDAARRRTERIDRVLLHPVIGPILFLLILGLFFAAVFGISDPVTHVCDALVRGVGRWLRPRLGDGPFASLVVDGVFGGAGTVLAFLPQLAILMAGMDLLEGSGYLSRAAFLADRSLRYFGFGGKAFVPLLAGHACAVPAIAATRVLRDPRERLTTILVIPLMTCSARLPVYSLVISAFIGGGLVRRSAISVALYLVGIVGGLVAGSVLRRTITRGRSLPMLLEMPLYRRPLLAALLGRVRREVVDFTRRVGTIILAFSVGLWLLLNVPVRDATPGQIDVPIERSAAAAIGRAAEPITKPIGFDWRINVGLLGSFGARELMVGTMGVIFGVENAAAESTPLLDRMRRAEGPDGRPAYGFATGVSLLIFFVFACQCVSTLSAIWRETRRAELVVFVVAYTYGVAWLASFVAYQVASRFG